MLPQFRYSQDGIYTLAGPVLIALNPCKAVPLYTTEVANAYKGVLYSASMQVGALCSRHTNSISLGILLGPWQPLHARRQVISGSMHHRKR